MERRILKFLSLGAAEKLLLLRATFQLVGIFVALRLLPFAVLKRSCERVARHTTIDPSICMSRIAYAVNAAGSFVPGTACLSRALVGQRMAGKLGIKTDLRIGVAKRSESLIYAHAWLEYEGRPVIGDSSELGLYSRF